MNSQNIKKLTQYSSILLIVAILLIVFIKIQGIFGYTKIQIEEKPARYYQGNATNAILVLGEKSPLSTLLLPMLKSTGSDILWMEDFGEQTLSKGFTMLSTLSDVPHEKISLLATQGASEAALSWYFAEGIDIEALLLISPVTNDIQALLDKGVYSCSFSGSTKTLILESITAPRGTIDQSVALYNLLSADQIKSNGSPARAQRGDVSLILSPGTVLSDHPTSVQMLEEFSGWLWANLGLSASSSGSLMMLSILWLVAFAALPLSLIGIYALTKPLRQDSGYGIIAADISKTWKFYIGRVVVCVLSLPITLGVFLLLGLLPVSFGGFGRLFISYTIAVGATIQLMYKYQIMPGVKSIPTDILTKAKGTDIQKALALAGAVSACIIVLGMSGFYSMQLTMDRLFLFGVLFLVLSVCMLAFSYELNVIESLTTSRTSTILCLLLPYFPLLILPIIAVPMGEISMFVAMIKCTILLICGILTGRIAENITKSAQIATMLSAFIVAGFVAFNTFI